MLSLLAAALLAQAHDAHVHGADDPNLLAHEQHKLDENAPKPRGKDLSLKVAGSSAKAYVARPAGKPKGAVLVLHEWWGLNDWIRAQSDRLADEGYLALAVDLYKGKVATDPKEAGALMEGRDAAFGGQVEQAGLDWLRKNGSGAKVVTLGWCFGGGESLRTSLMDPAHVSATVIYYGMPVTDVDKLKTLKGPVLGIFANQDHGITKEKVDAFDQALTAAGVKHEFHRYEADHAFANPSGGRYNGEAAKDAWEKTRAFLAAHFKG